ncbi:MAG: transcriptional regulator, family [Polaromonas sp.]|nr:transcriptional regulator, family [Polaromonas sp.]
MNVRVGARIAEERERLGLSQEAFAARAGVSFSSQRRYENGTRDPSTAYLANLRESCGVDVDYVLTGDRNSNMPQHRIIFALRVAILEVGKRLGCELEIAQHLSNYANLDASIYENGELIPDQVIDSFVNSCQVHIDAELLVSIFDGIETAAQLLNKKLSPKKKAQAVAMLYRSAKASGKVDPAMIDETVLLAAF